MGYHALRSIIRHPELELAGLWVHSPDKVGRDAGELADLDPVGVLATNDVESLLAVDAACVCYTATADLRPDEALDDICRILASGMNVVSTSIVPLVHPRGGDDAVQQMVGRLEAACREGGTSCFTSGIDPGFANDLLPITLMGACERIESVRIQEILNYATYEQPEVLFHTMGFGQPLDRTPLLLLPGVLGFAWGGVIRMMAEAAGAELDEIREDFERATFDRDIVLPYGTVEAGTQAGLRFEVQGIVDGEPKIIAEHVTRLDDDGRARVAVAGRHAGLLPDHGEGLAEPRLPPRDRERGRRPQHRRARAHRDAGAQRGARGRRRATRACCRPSTCRSSAGGARCTRLLARDPGGSS